MEWYILKDKIPVPASSWEELNEFIKSKASIIKQTRKDDILISTVFLVFNHGSEERPLFFETMIFGGPEDQYQKRYETYEEALNGHEEACIIALN